MTPHPESASTPTTTGLVLVMGATGFVGSHVVPALLAQGLRVRVTTSTPNTVRQFSWAREVEVVTADLRDPVAAAAALHNVDVAFFLAHSGKGGVSEFGVDDLLMARNVAVAATEHRVRKIVYLGGDKPPPQSSGHDAQPARDPGRVLASSRARVIELRTSVIIGPGSASTDMLTYLTRRLPLMVTPRWLNNIIRPIAIADLVHYLVQAATTTCTVSGTFHIGGPEAMTYKELIRRYAAVAGLRRPRIVTVPVLTPNLASYWVGLVTPLTARVARPLIESLMHAEAREVDDCSEWASLPSPSPTTVEKALAGI